MKFEVDSQTKKDLEIFKTVGNGTSVFDLFDQTNCYGGKKKIHDFLASPSTDLTEITERKEAFAFFQKHYPDGVNVDKNSLDFTEYYLRHANYPTKSPSRYMALEKILLDKLSTSNEYYLIRNGVSAAIDLLKTLYQFSQTLVDRSKNEDIPTLLLRNSNEVLKILSQPYYAEIIKRKKVKTSETTTYDYLFRYADKDYIRFFLDVIYEYDAFKSIAKAAEIYNFSYPEIVSDTENCLEIEGFFHPFVENAIANDISFDVTSNLLFVSGPNMAGKSTSLKALGVSVYLAHAGFPVPAAKMKLSLLSGLSTTINISDNLNSGYSHFYAEVMRIKDVANKLHQNNKMMVLFDELFRGTNVKDAYDGTLSIVSAFAKIRSSFFVISSHIVEVAKELRSNENIKFCYFDIREEDGQPVYTYKLKEGVTDIRLGMYIIKKEGLIELINSIKR
ncbi:MAG: hypothetical protein LBN74_00430 [Prevotella sp.]|nr:hypothetical protein [Prevotella sp.]